jgi:hypothetical protein
MDLWWASSALWVRSEKSVPVHVHMGPKICAKTVPNWHKHQKMEHDVKKIINFWWNRGKESSKLDRLKKIRIWNPTIVTFWSNGCLLQIPDHLRLFESFWKGSKGFLMFKKTHSLSIDNEFATKTCKCLWRCRVFICFCSRLDELWVFANVKNPFSLFEKNQDWVFCLKDLKFVVLGSFSPNGRCFLTNSEISHLYKPFFLQSTTYCVNTQHY